MFISCSEKKNLNTRASLVVDLMDGGTYALKDAI